MRSWDEARQARPDLQGVQRARLVLNYEEAGDRIQSSETGWAQVRGSWVHWISDEDEAQWQSWPREHVVCVEWLRGEEAVA